MARSQMSPSVDQSIDTLNSFLRGEISATETYRQAIAHFEKQPILELDHCLRSHQQRVEALRSRIRHLGGTPSEGSGAWGAFAQLVQGGATMLGRSAAIAALEQGEDQGRDDYKNNLDKLDPDSRRFIESEILPEEVRTHQTLSRLKNAR
jgi:demethoxyubiquinone hydroxylase (CLK1/Coq7/Cat5 family)